MKTSLKLFPGIAAALVALSACPPPPPVEQEVPKAATVKSFTAAPTELAAGEQATLSWEVTDATSVAITTLDGKSVPLTDAKAASGSVKVTVESNSVFVLTARGEGGEDTAATSVVVAEEPAQILFAVSHKEIEAGKSATLVWNAPKAEQIVITDAAGATVHSATEPAGSIDVSPSMTTTYTLTAGDRTATATVEVTPAIFAFSATPVAAAPGEQITLSWKVAGADTVTVSAEGRGELGSVTTPAEIADGSLPDTLPAVLPANGLVQYTLAAKLGSKIVTRNLTVYAGVDPLITSFTIPEFAKAGAQFAVSWATANADSVEISLDGTVMYVATSRALVASGYTTLTTPAAAATVKIIATNVRGGRTEKTATVAPVAVPLFVSFTATPATIANGGDPVALSWEVTNARHVRVLTSDGRLLAEAWGTTAETGSVQHYPNKQTTYTLQADNTVGDSISPQTVTVDVTTPAKLVFNPSTVPNGTTVQFTGTTVQGGGAIRAGNFTLKNSPGTAFVDISTTGNLLPFGSDEDTTAQVATFPAPFSTRVMGVPVTASAVSVSVNGWIVFSPTAKTGPSVPDSTLPETDIEPLSIAAFLDDLETGTDTKIHWQIDGTGAQQRLIVQWSDIYEYPYDQSPTKKATFQLQLYATGELVVAIDEVVGYTTSDPVAIGMQNADETAAFSVPTTQFTNGKHPVAGETFSFYGTVSLPVPVKATTTDFITVIQQVGTGEIEITDKPNIIPPDQFVVSEVNYNPATGKAEWFEVLNKTATAFDLGGWSIDFGGGNVHTIAGTVMLPANGRLLFGQTADAAEASSGGPAIDYVYGTTFVMPDASGSVAISLFGSAYTTMAWTTAGTQGVSLEQAVLRTDVLLASGTTSITCPSIMVYGSGTQYGTPGAQNGNCIPWMLQPVGATAFEPIALNGGTAIVGMVSTGNNSIDSVTKALDFTALTGRAVKIGGTLYGNAARPLYVNSNGWVSLVTTTSTNGANSTVPSSSTLPNGFFAVFWDDLAGNAVNATNPSGIYWKQFDPDATPNTGDEYTLISWENWKRYQSSTATPQITSSLNFQLKIHEGTGDVEYVYGNMTASNTTYANGTDATIWLESLDGRQAIEIGTNDAILNPNTSYRFNYTP